MKFFAISILLIITTFGNVAFSQDDLKFGDTPTTSHNPKYKHDHKDHKKRQLVQFIKNDSKGLYLGNNCIEDIYIEMGFAFLVQVNEGNSSQKGPLGRYFHNVGTSVAVFFRNGPFWRIRLRKRKKECLMQTRDFMG